MSAPATIPVTGSGTYNSSSSFRVSAEISYGLSAATTIVDTTTTNASSPARQEPVALVTTTPKDCPVPTDAIAVIIQPPDANTIDIRASNATGTVAAAGIMHNLLPTMIALDSSWTHLWLYASADVTVNLTWL